MSNSDIGLRIGAEVLQEFEAASAREWLVTNGIGGYASSSLSGANMRRYHGLLIAALAPPTGRMATLSKLEATVEYGGQRFELGANQYPGAVYPQGYRYLAQFDPWPAPSFLYTPQPGLAIRFTIWMAHGQNTTYVRYAVVEAPEPVVLELAPLIYWRDFHAEMHPWDGFPTSVDVGKGGVGIRFTPESPTLRMLAPGAEWTAAGWWNWNVQHVREQERGLDCQEDLYCPGILRTNLGPGASYTIVATLEESKPEAADASWASLLRHQVALLDRCQGKGTYSRQLELAANSFVIERQAPNVQRVAPVRSTIIAGYHWFSDWGRDTMIALPGLCLATLRHEIAADILRSYACVVSEGMLPNRFPDRGEAPEYNTADATLWYFQAIWAYVQQAEDGFELARELWSVLADIIAWHQRGTRFGIGVDHADGLLRAGVPGVQLTWMDAKVGDLVVTPRIGKPVEINALWYNGLRVMQELAIRLQENPEPYRAAADRAGNAFRERFVRPDGLGLYDVVADDGPDASIRPNQIFAASLTFSPLDASQREAVVRVVQERLLTPFGLRTLDPADPAYRPHYGGGVWERDSAYHQGTVWPWLLGAFVEAHLRVYNDLEAARSFLEPLQAHLRDAGVGYISEVFNGDPPHAPNGCIAQAWSVGEILRAWRLVNGPSGN